jgi:HEAT repeat protein
MLAAALLAGQQAPQQSDPRQRVRLARDLVRQGSAAIPQLRPLLKDPALEVRLEAVKSIVAIGTHHSLEPLVEAAADNDAEIQIRAADGLVNFYAPGYVQTGIGSTLRRAGGMVSARFTDNLDQVIDPWVEVRPEVVAALGAQARGGVAFEVRANAARALGILRGRAAIPSLIEALRTKDSRVLFEVLVALRKIGDSSAGPETTFLLRDFDERVQIAAIETAGVLINREALPRLRDVLSRTGSNAVRRAALAAVAMMPEEADRPLLRRFMADRDDSLRAAAAEGIGRLKDRDDLAALDRMFQEERGMRPRLAAAFAVVMVGRRELTELSPLQYLINQLNSRAWRGIAQPYLVELAREKEVRQGLLLATRSAMKAELVLLLPVIAATAGPEAIPYIEPLTRHAEPEVAQEAIRSLRTLRARAQ